MLLILYDIDMTLVSTGGAGFRAMLAAGAELFGDSFTGEGVDFGGKLDPIIIADLLRASGVEHTPERADAMREGYVRHLERILVGAGVVTALPGAADLVAATARLDGVHLGLLTGNFPESGELKLRSGGFDTDLFPVKVWGSDSPHAPPSRNDLPPIAIKRYEQLTGRSIGGQRVVIIGDTIHDVECAKSNACRVIAVATGRTSRDRLEHAGADLALNDLTDIERIIAWLMR